MLMRMGHKRKIMKYRRWYAKLLRFYPESFYRRFGQSMEQTFGDLCWECTKEKSGLARLIIWVFYETSANILKERFTTMKNKRLVFIVIGIACVLLVPFMLGAPWDELDYIVGGFLLLAAGLGFELIMRNVAKVKHRAAIIIALLAVLFLTWVELAVGLFGTPFAGN